MNIDNALDYIQEDDLQEFDPILTGVFGTGYLISSLIFFIIATTALAKSLKVDAEMSKRINEILNSGNRWEVHRYPDKTPNAFALGMGRHVFVTDGLVDLLTKRELEAVLLHEIHHNKNKDTYKSFAAKHAFFYLVTYLAFSISIVSWPLGILAFILLNKSSNIALKRILGRGAEIKADKFAVQYGYGKDLISSLQKIDKVAQQIHSKKPCGTYCQYERKVSEMIDEHPPLKKRVEIILTSIDKTKNMNFAQIKDFVANVFKENG